MIKKDILMNARFGDLFKTKNGYKATFTKKQHTNKGYEFQFIVEIPLDDEGWGTYTIHTGENGGHKDRNYSIVSRWIDDSVFIHEKQYIIAKSPCPELFFGWYGVEISDTLLLIEKNDLKRILKDYPDEELTDTSGNIITIDSLKI